MDLEELLDREGGGEEVTNWGEVLSLGEQQRLGMARLFYHRPRFAILDECTSGVTVDMEERFCVMVKDMGCTCVTISHRPALMAFHDVVLALDGECRLLAWRCGTVVGLEPGGGTAFPAQACSNPKQDELCGAATECPLLLLLMLLLQARAGGACTRGTALWRRGPRSRPRAGAEVRAGWVNEGAGHCWMGR